MACQLWGVLGAYVAESLAVAAVMLVHAARPQRSRLCSAQSSMRETCGLHRRGQRAQHQA
jgi:hypothetical protein